MTVQYELERGEIHEDKSYKVGWLSSTLILFGCVCCIAALPLGLYWHIRHAMEGVGVEMTGEAAAARPPGNNFEKNRTAYLLVLSLELIALLSVCLITMV